MISTAANGTRKLQVNTPAGRKIIRLGKMNLTDARQVLGFVERLASAKFANAAPPTLAVQWLEGIHDKLHDRIARAGLCDPREGPGPRRRAARTVGTLFAGYIARRTDLKPGTVLVLRQAERHANTFFGADRAAAGLTVAEAKDFRRHLAGKYSEAYTAKMVRQARTVWRDAVDRKLVTENPFAAVRAGSARNVERQRFIDRPTIEKVIEQAPDAQWKLLIALSRYAGLRCPSEHLALTWADIDWANGRMLVRSSKTEHHAGKATRLVPIFPELRPHLQRAFDEAAPGELYVITRYRQANSNLRTQFMRYITAAGLVPWPRLFHNLRASCQTDLAERFPGHVVCAWIGNSLDVARDHYLQVTDAHFERATAAPAAGEPEKKATQKATQQPAAMGRNESHSESLAFQLPPKNEKTPAFAGVSSGPE